MTHAPWALVLAGGDGRRLQELTRRIAGEPIPEHLVTFRVDDTGWSDWGTEQAIERTFAVLALVPPWRDSTPQRVAS